MQTSLNFFRVPRQPSSGKIIGSVLFLACLGLGFVSYGLGLGDMDEEVRELWDHTNASSSDIRNSSSGQEVFQIDTEEEEGQEIEEEEEEESCDHFHGTHIKLDTMHGMNRIFETWSKRHGVTPYVASRCRDAIFSPCKEDVEAVKVSTMRLHNWNEAQWKAYAKSNWRDVLTSCRRVIHAPAIILERLKRIAEVYANIKDAATNEPLFSKRTWKKWKAFMKHVERGCLSDPDPSVVTLYHVLYYKKSNGLPVYCCARGTSQLEGYHQKLRDAVPGWNCTPEMADCIMSEFVYRWNLMAASRYSGLPDECTGFFEQWRLEKIQDITSGWYPTPLFQHWKSTR